MEMREWKGMGTSAFSCGGLGKLIFLLYMTLLRYLAFQAKLLLRAVRGMLQYLNPRFLLLLQFAKTRIILVRPVRSSCYLVSILTAS